MLRQLGCALEIQHLAAFFIFLFQRLHQFL